MMTTSPESCVGLCEGGSFAIPSRSSSSRQSARDSLRDALPQLFVSAADRCPGSDTDNVNSPTTGEKPNNSLNADDRDWDITFSFSCGGWFMMYFFGVAHALVDSGVLQRWQKEGRRVRFCGASAGSLAACCLAAGQHDFESVRDYAIMSAKKFRSSISNLFKMKTYLEESLLTLGGNLREIERDPKFRAYMESGCLEISLTILPQMKNRVVSSFSNYEQIREAIMASCCMVPLVGMPFRLAETGEWVTDGGFSSFTPRMNEPNVVSVSAMYFQDATVRPRVFVPSWWALLPPREEKYRNLFWMGFNDMIDSLVGMGELDVKQGEEFLKPETDFCIHDTYFDVFVTFVVEILMLISVRPVVVTCVYVELLLSMVWYSAKTVLTLDGVALGAWYENLRNAISLRTLGRLLFGTKVPNNEKRLSRHSLVFRLFNPIVLGGNKKTGREHWSPSGSPLGKSPSFSPTVRKQSTAIHSGN